MKYCILNKLDDVWKSLLLLSNSFIRSVTSSLDTASFSMDTMNWHIIVLKLWCAQDVWTSFKQNSLFDSFFNQNYVIHMLFDLEWYLMLVCWHYFWSIMGLKRQPSSPADVSHFQVCWNWNKWMNVLTHLNQKYSHLFNSLYWSGFSFYKFIGGIEIFCGKTTEWLQRYLELLTLRHLMCMDKKLTVKKYIYQLILYNKRQLWEIKVNIN